MALGAAVMPIFLPLRSLIDLSGESASTMNCDSAICVDKTIFTGMPSAMMAIEVADGAPKARSIACVGIARVGPLTSANFTHSMSRPSFSANFICSITAPKPSEKPLVQ